MFRTMYPFWSALVSAIFAQVLKPFFYLALGFGASQYLGEKAPADVILEALGINKPKEKTTEATVTEETTTNNVTACPNCGAKVEMSNSKFCTNCGKKL